MSMCPTTDDARRPRRADRLPARTAWWTLLLPLLLLAAQLPAVAAAQPLPRDTSARVGTLPNGLTYYVRGNAEPRQRAELRLVVNVGSVMERRNERGVAHFVEHMAFNGTRRFAEQELVDYLESVGMRFGPDINAYTSFDETVYLLTLPTDSAGVLETGVRILRDWADGIAFDSVEVEKERGVVIEEWRLGQGAGSRLRNRHLPVLFRGSRYAERLPIGDTAVLHRVRPSQLRAFYRAWYRPELMAVVAVGDFDVDAMERWIREEFASMPASARRRARPGYPVPSHGRTLISVATDAEATGASVGIYRKRAIREGGTIQSFRRYLVETLYHFMLYDRLAEETLKQDSPLLSVSSAQGVLVRTRAADILSATVRPERVPEALDALLIESRRVAQHGFTHTELARQTRDLMRRWEQIYAEREFTPSAQYASEYISHFLYGDALLSAETHFEMHRRLLPTIALEEVNAYGRAAAGGERDRVVLVTVPKSDSTPPPKPSALAAVLAASAGRSVAPYADEVSDLPLVGRPPMPGTVAQERLLPEIGVHVWTLSNGARVVLKPTDFKADEILFAAYAPGGTSLAPDSLFIPALTASGVAQMGGLGDLTLTELVKRLSGKVAGAGAFIDEVSQGLSGAASPADLETLFQVVHLRFTAPRVDSTAFLAYQSRAMAELRHRGASPEAVLQDTLQLLLAQGHPRARPPSSEMFEAMDLHRSIEFYRARFADASGFTFFFVGNFHTDSIRPLVERYLASLPGDGGAAGWRDVGIRPPRGVVQRTVRRGSEPKAQTRIVFTGDFAFERANLYAMNTLAEVLQLRLREVLREELGGTYGAQVGASATRDPYAGYRLSIAFGSAPERVEELTAAVFAQIESLKRVGPTPQEIEKVREMQLRAREVRLRENSFWIGQLLTHHRFGWDLGQIPTTAERARSLGVDVVQRTAQQLLDTRNYVRVSLVPEGG
jgi:zinc protease